MLAQDIGDFLGLALVLQNTTLDSGQGAIGEQQPAQGLEPRWFVHHPMEVLTNAGTVVGRGE